MSDYYSILGISKSASQDEIKKAYRKLAAIHHPDRGGDTAKFQEIQAAYDVLSNPQKKSEYDNPPQQHFNNFNGVPPGFEDIFSNMFGGDFSNIFGRHQHRQHNVKNKTLTFSTQITLEDAYTGKDVLTSIKLPSGKERTIEVKIPPGIRDNTTLRLAGMGDDSISNIPPGDIHLTISIQPHKIFKRNNDDLIMDTTITCFDAILGKKLEFVTLSGKTLETIIPAGIQPGQLLNINGHGMPNMSNPLMKGRLLINLNISIPTTLTEQQKEDLKKIIHYT